MKKTIKYVLLTFLLLLLFFAVFLIFATITDYQPKNKIILKKTDNYSQIIDSSFTIMTWNIGYAGLGADMDFFYDGGKQIRTSKKQTIENLKQITKLIKKQNDIDFFLFQEVDVKAKRTYYINESDSIKKAFPKYFNSYTDNFLVNYIPVPILEPLGSVKSGIQISSKQIPILSDRYNFPGNFDWPTRIFTLDRGFLVNRYKLIGGKELLIINTHNSAFDDGSLKLQQIKFLIDFLKSEVLKGNHFVVGGDWNQNPPEFDATNFITQLEGDTFKLSVLDKKLFPKNWNFNFDNTIATARSNVKPYQERISSTTILDFFLTSPGLKANFVKGIDLNFKNSDHQPVIMNFEIIK